jgi:spermidine synthase
MANDELPGENGLLIERLADDAGYFIRGGRLLERRTTAYQEIEVWDTPRFGRLFRLDGCCMTSERDEFHYHENLAHVAAITHRGPLSALIVGGGDGGSAEEILKHPTLKRIVIVELDAGVVDIARRYLQSVHRGALDDPRVEVHIDDGLAYVHEQCGEGGERFDLIVLDLTDPVGAARPLHAEAFFLECRTLLATGGALSLHLGSVTFQREQVRAVTHRLRAVFAVVRPYLVYIPLYGSLWGLATASDMLDPLALAAAEVDSRIAARRIDLLQHYNGAVHHAQFALPNHLRALLA